MEKIDIKALARELKQKASGEQGKPSIDASKEVVFKKEENISVKKGASGLKSILDAANQRSDFVLEQDIRIDVEVHDILRQIKTRTKLVIGNLASVLLEDFILQHKTEIARLLKKKTNRLI